MMLRKLSLSTAALLAAALLIANSTTSCLARGSFGGGGFHSFGGGGFHSFGGGNSFHFSPPTFRPAPAFHPFTPAPMPVPAFRPAPTPIPAPPVSAGMGSGFGRTDSIGSVVSNHFTPTGSGGSFGRAGVVGSRSFTSLASHAPPPTVTYSFGPTYHGAPYRPAFYHPYYYNGRPAPVFFTGGFGDYSYGYYHHPWLGYFPWSPVFYTNPPIYTGQGYVSGGFSWLRLLLGILFWIIVLWVVVAIIRKLTAARSSGSGYTGYI